MSNQNQSSRPAPVSQFNSFVARIKQRAAATPALIFAALVILSLPIHAFKLQEPLTGEHEFRQTQTALSVWEIREHGFSLLHPKLPLFGPPWECPMEYPVFQTAAAVVDAIAPWDNLDVSIRITNLTFYYSTAVTLYLLARLLFTGPGVVLLTSAVFLFSPFNILWSRTSMIEYAATFFALAYLLLFVRWIIRPGWTLFAFSLLFGVLACLTKITTFIIPLFVAGVVTGLIALRWLRARWKSGKQLNHRDSANVPESGGLSNAGHNNLLRPTQIVLMGIMLAAPVLVGHAYIKFSDKIKGQSTYTAWLSSDHPYLKTWNYGTLSQRLNPGNWNIILRRMRETVIPSFAIVTLIGLCLLPFRICAPKAVPGGGFWMGLCIALSPFVAVLTLFNLYRIHTYYLIACAPILALCTGAGFHAVFKLIKGEFIRLLCALCCIGIWLYGQSPRIARLLYSSSANRSVDYLAEASKLIGKDEPVIIVSSQEWSSFAPYYLKRRAFMARLANKPVSIRPYLETNYFKAHGFRWLLTEGNAPDMSELTAEITNRWKSAQVMTVPVTNAPYVLYSLSDE